MAVHTAERIRPRRDALTLARRVAFGLLLVDLVVLAGTGVWLVFNYLPREHGIRPVHALASAVGGPLALVACALLITDAAVHAAARRRAVAFGVALAVLMIGVVTSMTGWLLPWDQLALKAVTVGDGIKGYRGVWNGAARFVLIRDAEVTAPTVTVWLVVHLVGGVVATALTAAAAVVTPRRRRAVP